MASARILCCQSRLRYCGFLGVAAGFGFRNLVQKKQKVLNDGPGPNQLPRDHLPAQHDSSPSKTANQYFPRKEKHGSPSPEEHDEIESYPAFQNDEDTAWATFSRNINGVRESLTDTDWSGVGDRITEYILPTWARELPDQLRKLQSELSPEPGSLADEIWQEAAEANINPEIEWDASVRVSDNLCRDELDFRKKRRQRLVPALARYLDLDEKEIDPDDIPTIALCGSGGGLRALVASTGSMLAAQEDGLFDCATYTAGVSGSCWLQTLYHTGLGKQNFHELVRHLKNRLDVHIAFPPPALQLITSAPTDKFLLSGFVEKLRGDPGADFGLVDIYGLLLGARLMVPKGELGVSNQDLKLSNQRAHLDQAGHPLPIYTAVRHEIPVEKTSPGAEQDDQVAKKEAEEKAKKEAWFQWFEFTPYEVFCEEFSAGIPTWALGRPFEAGRNMVPDDGFRQPELRLPLMLGIWGSAFCATLSHYYQEIKPALVGLAGFDGVDNLFTQNRDDLVKYHPIDPATVPNFAHGMKDRLPASCPDSIWKNDNLELMDAGMSNNLPIYPLLRPGREVDILVTFDTSADKKKDNWLSVVDGYARQRGISGWPVGAGWPQPSTGPAEAAQSLGEAQAITAQGAGSKIPDAREKSNPQTSDTTVSESTEDQENTSSSSSSSTDLGYCTIWVGNKSERISTSEPPPSKRLEASTPESETSFNLMLPSAALAVVYFPFLANPSKVPGIDPDTSDFMSTWNFIYTPDQVEQVVALARANFDEGKDQTRRCVRAVYERKKMLRLRTEAELEEEEEKGLHGRLRKEGDHFI